MASEAFGEFLRERSSFCVLASPDHVLLQVFGDSRKFLRIPEGKSPLDVTQLVPKPLSLPLSTALHRARVENSPIAYNGIKVELDGEMRSVDLHVSCHAGANACPEFLMVLFQVAGRAVVPADQFELDSHAVQRIADLENDLQQSKENLQATIEELETTNEEQQATNQEMLAANEELQSTNEELQSVNEELYSVNAEYQSKIQELTDLNNDMDNLLSSIDIGTVFLDKKLQIRKFTPAVSEVIKLQEHDIGRPFDQIANRIDMDHDQLFMNINRVLVTGEPSEFSVEARSGVPLLMRINPYRDEANRAQGVVLTFVNVSKLKQAEEAVRRSEQRVRQVLEAATSAIVMVRGPGEIVLVNSQTEKYFGYPRDELIGRQVETLVPEMFRNQCGEHRPGSLAGPTTAPPGGRRELYGQRKDGSEFPVEVGLSPVDTQDGPMVLATIVDITQRVRDEQDRSRLAAIVQSSHDAIIGKTIKGQITSWNRGAEQMYGYKAKEAIGQSVSMLLPADRPAEVAQLLARLKQGQPIEDFETQRRTKDGRQIDVSLTISPLLGRHGQVVGASTIARDITERKRTEIKLRLLQSVTEVISSSRDFESAMKRALTLICESIGWDYGEAWIPNDDHGGLERCPGAFLRSARLEPFARASRERIFPPGNGLPGHVWSSREPKWYLDVSSEPDEIFVRAETAAQVGIMGGFAVPIVAGARVLAVLNFFITSKPREENLALAADLVHSVASHLGSVVRRKRIDAELQRTHTELENKNREMEEFVYTVSHDLKTPLVTLGGMLGMLKEELQEERFVDAGEIIVMAEDTVVGMCDTIADLLKLSQLGRLAGEMELLSLNELACEAVGKHAQQLQSKGITVEVIDNNATVLADRNRLREVFDNIIVNAMKYACDGSDSRIVIGSHIVDREIHLFVKDNGPGIAPEDHEKVFGLFQRLDVKKEGSGVGLTIVRRIMEVHGGRAWVESELGAGATFWLVFPPPVGEAAPAR